MNETLKKNKALIVTALAAGATLAYLFGLFLPGQKAIAQQREELEMRRLAVSEADQFRINIHEALGPLEETERYVASRRAALPNTDQMPALFSHISDEVEQAGVSLVRFEPHAPETLATLTIVPVFLTVEGQFGEIYSMLGRLEQLAETIWIDTIQLEQHGEAGESVRCELNLAIFAGHNDVSH